MKILFIYRSKDAGPSIRRVFNCIEKELKCEHIVDSIYLPKASASPLSLLKNVRYVKNYIKNKHYDLIHVTGGVYYLTLCLSNYKTVVTVHDLGFYTRLNYGAKKALIYFLFIYSLKFAGHITYISKKSYNEANKLVKLNKENQSVVYNPVDPEFVSTPKFVNYDTPTILHIGTKANKNLERVIEAVSSIRCKLHVIGCLSEKLMNRIKELGVNVCVENRISDNEMLNAYKECDVVCFPSLYEGFGMPIIEGQAIGRPVVTSDIEPMRTIAGKSAILVNPYSEVSIKNGILKALDLYDDLVDLGYENVRHFSLKNIVNDYIDVYNKVLCN